MEVHEAVSLYHLRVKYVTLQELLANNIRSLISSGVAKPGPTRACTLPSTFQALPSAAQQDSHDSTSN